MKVLVVCNAAIALGYLYSAYHTATFLFGFPDSPGLRWLSRFVEVFPSLSVVLGLSYEMTGKALVGSAVEGSRLPGVILDLVLGVGAGAIAYGLARYAIWARKVFGITAALTVLLHLIKLTPIGLHLFAGSFRNYFGSLLSARSGPQYAFFGLFISGGIAWLMWRWREEPAGAVEQIAAQAAPRSSESVSNAWIEAKRARLKKWLWGVRIALILLGLAIALNAIATASSWRVMPAQQAFTLLLWLTPIPVICYLVSREDSRLGVGLAVGFAAVQLLPYIGMASSRSSLGLLFLMGFQTWPRIAILLVPSLAAIVVLVCGLAATLQLGRATAQSAGKWGMGVLMPFLAALVLYQVTLESSYAKAPAMTRDQWANQSKEYGRGHKSRLIVVTIGKCLFQYAAAHPQEGFPANLEQLGQSGNACLQGEKTSLQTPGYAFLYEASNSVPGGTRDRFKARSKQVEHIPGTFSLPDTIVDETGIFASLEGDKRGFAFSPELVLLNGIAVCLKRDFDAAGSGSYPQNLRGLLSIKAEYGTQCVQPFQANELSMLELWRNKFTYRFYDYTYLVTNETGGKYKGFHLEARPKEYGKEELRSYFIDESGKARATPYNRAPNIGDPDADCELKQQSCSIPLAPDVPK
jgi:hypothetical protein